MDNTREDNGVKNFFIYELFNFIFGIIVPIIFLLIDVAWVSVEGNELVTKIQLIVFTAQLVLIFALKEMLICMTAKRAAKSNYLMSKFVFIFNTITILILTIMMFNTVKGDWNEKFFITHGFTIFMGLIVCKMLSYVLAKKVGLKEKLEHKLPLIIGAVSYLIIVSVSFFIVAPSNLNKLLFETIGKSQFSSKELQITLVNYYNEKCGSVNYSHNFNQEELECFEDLTLNQKITNEDIAQLHNLNTLTLKNVEIENLDFSSNKKLVRLEINNSNISKVNTNLLGKVQYFKITNSDIKEFNVNDKNVTYIDMEKNKINILNITDSALKEITGNEIELENLSVKDTTVLNEIDFKKSIIDNAVLDNNALFDDKYDINNHIYINVDLSKVNNLVIKNPGDFNSFLKNARIVFKNIEFLDNKGLNLENDNYLKLNGAALNVPEGTRVKELILKNMTAIVKDHYYKKISCDDTGTCTYDTSQLLVDIQEADEILSDSIELYDSNNVKIFEWSVYDYKDSEI